MKEQKEQKPMDFSRYQRLHVCLRIAYDGSTYDGLAIQDHTPNTIEEVLLRACVKLRLVPDLFEEKQQQQQQQQQQKQNTTSNNSDDKTTTTTTTATSSSASDWINFSRCGRTDKGVSAMGNAVSLFMRGASLNSNSTSASSSSSSTTNTTPTPLYDKSLNRVLPSSIRVIGYCIIDNERSPNFDARFSCRARSYRYFFDAYQLNLSKMKEAAKLLEGKHDFRNLCHMDVVAVSNFVREVMSAKIRDATTDEEVSSSSSSSAATHNHNHRMCYLDIRANAFLYHQIRCIMTILLSVGAELEQPDEVITKLLLNTDENPRKPVYPLADPAPLVLWNCEYDKKDIPQWTCDEATVRQQYLQELEMEANAARVKAAACVSMKNMMVKELMNSNNTNTNTNTENNNQKKVILNATTSFLYSNPQQAKYIPLVNRGREKSFEEKVASLSGKRKERMTVNNALKKEGGNRRARDE